MSFAPLFFLRGRSPQRTQTQHANPVHLHDTCGRTMGLTFHRRDTAFFNRQAYPAHDAAVHTQSTLFYPPAHYHLFADELFEVTSGAGAWHLWDGRTVRVSKGQTITVPRRKWHTFVGDASADDPLTIEVCYDKGKAAMEERFFRNTLGYLADCHREGATPSVFQLMVFFVHYEMAPGLKMLPWETPNLVANTLLMLVMAGIGEFLLGYRKSYPEYYDPSFNKPQ